jgi:hypothetical protein
MADSTSSTSQATLPNSSPDTPKREQEQHLHKLQQQEVLIQQQNTEL